MESRGFTLFKFTDFVSRQSRLLLIDGKTYVLKEYASEVGLLKWYFIATSNLPIGIYPFKLNPYERMMREVEFMRHAEKCFKRPELFAVDYKSLRVIREYVKGEVYGYNAPVNTHYALGKGLWECHKSGWSLGDTKVTNFVFRDGEIYIVDAEQAINEFTREYAAWDLLVLVSTLSMDGYLKPSWNNHPRIIDALLRGYLEENGEAIEVIETLRKGEFKLLSYVLIPFPFNIIYSRKLDEVIKTTK